MTQAKLRSLRPISISLGLAGAALFSILTPASADHNDRYDRGYDRGYSNSGYQTQYIKCQSKDYERTIRCRSYGKVKSARIYDRLSKASCSYERDWGYAHDGVWVRNGCRAVFAVSYSGGNRYGYNDGYNRDRGYDRTYDRDRDGYSRDRQYNRNRYGYNDSYGGRYGNRGVERCIAKAERRLNRDGFRRARLQSVDKVKRYSHVTGVRMTFRTRHKDHFHYPSISCESRRGGDTYLTRYDFGDAGRQCGYNFRLDRRY